jgi:hypothetical protein
MAKTLTNVQRFLQWSIVPVLCSMLVGYLLFQDNIFNRTYGVFQFTWSAVVAAIFYYMLVMLRQRDAVLGLIVLFGLTLLTTGSTTFSNITRDILYFGSTVASSYVYFLYFRSDTPENYARPAFLFGGIYGILYSIAIAAQVIIVRNFVPGDPEAAISHVVTNGAFFGVLIGFAVGAGISINEKFFGAKARA